jgi:hypothetical protein
MVQGETTRRAAILKRAAAAEVCAEAFAGLLLNGWGLTVAEPLLVDENGTLAFASADLSYPNLKQRFGVSEVVNPAKPAEVIAARIAMNQVCLFGSTPLAMACDEAIQNRDRNLGNILWDGTTEAWIDHAYAFGNGSGLPDQNKLCIMATGTPYQDKLKAGAVAHALTLGNAIVGEAESGISSTVLPVSPMATLVAGRLSGLAGRILARFPQPSDLLTNA